MKKYKYSDEQQKINNVLTYQDEELNHLMHDSQARRNQTDAEIEMLEKQLRSLGIDPSGVRKNIVSNNTPKKLMIVPSWDTLCKEAEAAVGIGCKLEDLFSEEELKTNVQAIKMLNAEYKQIHRLDKVDIGISAFAGIIGAVVDILLVGIPQKTPNGLSAGRLSDFIREKFDEVFPADEMEKLANSKLSKVPYDAQDNRNTIERVTGLSAYYHRMLLLGHDPFLGFAVGVFDILTGRMTTIDKEGKFISQIMENYANRKESDIFAALGKQIIHLKSDITTSMGLPVPLMGVFNLFQFGSIGEYEQTVAEIVQGMYYEGYDFIHFCSMSIPTMIVEVIVRLGYAFKRIKEGNKIKESIPFSTNREKHPKLATILFIGHSAATAINAGKVAFTKNPMAINYPQWIAFAKYSYSQAKWILVEKTEMQDKYVSGKLNDELSVLYAEIDQKFDEWSSEYRIIME